MAVLEKIRKRSVLLILVIGLALFAFVISDFIGKGRLSYGSQNIAEVNGEDILADTFRQRVDYITSQNRPASTMQVVNNVWEDMVNTKIVSQQMDLLGLGVHPESTIELIKSNAMFTSAPIFKDENGVFDINKVLEYILDLKSNNPEGYENWKQQEQALQDYFKKQSYFSLIKSGMIASPIEGEFRYKNETETVDFDYATIPYTTIPDSEIKISDKEVADYLKAHKTEFEREKTRNLKFVFFEEKPSEADEKAVSESLKKLLAPSLEYNTKTNLTDTIAAFGQAVDAKSFVNEHSDLSFQEKFFFKSDLPVNVADSIAKLKPHDVFGPYKDGEALKLSRVLESRKVADSSKASHIFVTYVGSPVSTPETKMDKPKAKAYIDSIFKVLKSNPAKFSEIADLINTDGTKGKGGDIGWQRYSTISYDNFDKAFAEYIFFREKGSLDIVESRMGFHIVKIDDQKQKKDAYKLATIVRHVDPSEETINDIYTKVTQFESTATKGKERFEDLAKAHNLQVSDASNLTEVSDYVSFLGPQRNIVQWAFGDEAEKGSIKRFNVSKGYALVFVDEVYDKGLMSVAQARPLVTPSLQRSKKAKAIQNRYKASSMEQIASEAHTPIASAVGLSAKRPFTSGLYGEEALVGTALSMENGETSSLIEGFLGVFKLKVLNRQKSQDLPNYARYCDELNSEFGTRIESKVYGALRTLSEVEDNRAQFY